MDRFSDTQCPLQVGQTGDNEAPAMVSWPGCRMTQYFIAGHEAVPVHPLLG